MQFDATGSSPRRVPQRNCREKCTYFFCRTWFFEVLFTLLPSILLALVIGGIYQYEEASRTHTTEQIYQHSVSPVATALRAFLDRKVRSLETLTAFIEGGGWPDLSDFNPITMQVVPYFARADQLRMSATATYQAENDVVEVGFEMPGSAQFALYSNPSVQGYVSQQVTRLYTSAGNVITRDRFINFEAVAPGQRLGLFAPNMSVMAWDTAMPWSTYAGEQNSGEVLFGNDLLPGSDQLRLNHKESFGMFFEAMHPFVVSASSASTTAYASHMFVQFDETVLFAGVSPACSESIHAVVFDPVSGRLAFFNCAGELGHPADPQMLGELGSLGITNQPTPAHVKISPIRGMNRAGVSAGTEQWRLATAYFTPTGANGALQNANGPWPGHDMMRAALERRVLRQYTLVSGIRSFVSSRMSVIEDIEDPEEYFAGVLMADDTIASVYQLLPARSGLRTLASFRIRNNEQGTKTFRHQRFDPNEPRRQTLLRFFATDRINCASPTALIDRQACRARELLVNGTTSFESGFGERFLNYHMGSDVVAWSSTSNLGIPEWVDEMKNLSAATNARVLPGIHLAQRRGSDVVTLMRMARTAHPKPTAPWSNPMLPAAVYLRHSFGSIQLTDAMSILLGEYRQTGRMKVIDQNLNIIAEAGALQLDFDDTVTVKYFNDFIRPRLTAACDSSSDSLICDVVTRTPLAFLYKRRISPISETYIAFSHLASFPNTGHWYVQTTLPSQVITTITTTEKIIGGTAVFIAVLFLVVNAGYVAWSTSTVVDLKRHMRNLAQNRGQDVALSSNTEVREIELALRKTKRAIEEYSKFLPTGLERGQDLPDEDTARVAIDAQANPSSTAGAASPAPVPPAGAAYDDREMNMRPSDSVANVEAPASPPRTYDDMLLSHQVGVARRDMAIVSLDLAHLRHELRHSGPNAISVLLANIAPAFHEAVAKGGGMLVPFGGGAGLLCAVWSTSRMRSARLLAATAAVTIGNAIASNMPQYVRTHAHVLQASIVVTFGDVDVGMVGSEEGRKTMVFAGEAFDRIKTLHRAMIRDLKRVGCAAPTMPKTDDGELNPVVGCGVSVVCDAPFVNDLPEGKVLYVPNVRERSVVHLIGVPRPQPPGAPAGEEQPEKRLMDLMWRVPASMGRPDPAVTAQVLPTCRVALLRLASKPLSMDGCGLW